MDDGQKLLSLEAARTRRILAASLPPEHTLPYRLARLAVGASALALLQVLAFFLGVKAEQTRASRMDMRAATWIEARRICPTGAQEFLHSCLAEVPTLQSPK